MNLWNVVLLDTQLHLLDIDIPSKHFVNLQDVLKTSSASHFFVFQDVFKMSYEMSLTHLQDVLENKKLLCWRCVEDVFKTCLVDIFKTSCIPTNVCWASTDSAYFCHCYFYVQYYCYSKNYLLLLVYNNFSS